MKRFLGNLYHRVREFNESPAEHVALNDSKIGISKFGMVGGSFDPVPRYPMKMPVQSVTAAPIGISSQPIEVQPLYFVSTGEGS